MVAKAFANYACWWPGLLSLSYFKVQAILFSDLPKWSVSEFIFTINMCGSQITSKKKILSGMFLLIFNYVLYTVPKKVWSVMRYETNSLSNSINSISNLKRKKKTPQQITFMNQNYIYRMVLQLVDRRQRWIVVISMGS